MLKGERGGAHTMTAHAPHSMVSLVLPAEPASVRAARQVLQRAAADAGADSNAVGIAVSEAVANAVEHAYPGEEGEIHVRAQANDVLRVIVTDRGTGLDPWPRREERPHFGLPLINGFADAVELDSGADGVQVEMLFGRAA